MGIPSFIIAAFSFIKVEKVVNPPQKPVVSSRRVLGVSQLFIDSEEIKPMMKQPKTLTVKVPNGKVELHETAKRRDTRKRNPPPKKLPKPTSKKSLNIFFCGQSYELCN